MATTGLPASLTSSGISPPNPKRDCSVTAAASTVATPASMALPPLVKIRKPASTSRLLAAPTISCVPRTGGNMVWRTWAEIGARRRRLTAETRRRREKTANRLECLFDLRFIFVQSLGDGNADHFDAFQICRADAVALGQEQRVVASLEWGRATFGARVVAHDGGGDSVGGDGIGSGDQHARLNQAQRLTADPWAFAAGYGFDTIDDGEIHRTSGDYIGHNVRHAIAGIVVDAEVYLRRSGARWLPFAGMANGAAAVDRLFVRLIDAGAVTVDRSRRVAEAVFERQRHAAGFVVLEFGHAHENVGVLENVVEIERRVHVGRAGDFEPRVALALAKIVGVFEFDAGRGIGERAHVPAGIE